MIFTLVSTIYNEASRLKQTIADLEAQTLKPSEIIITDAGSKDGSTDILEEWKQNSNIKITVLIEKGCNVARGRNLAIEAANTEWIVSTDFGCHFHPNWLQTLLKPLIKSYQLPATNYEVIGGAFTIIEKDIVTLAAKSDYILQKGYPVIMDEYFSVSSRSIAYKKDVWEHIGGYPEWLTLAADDTIFWKLIKKYGFNYVFVKEPMVYWGRHKTNKAFAKEAFRYGMGDGESRINLRNFMIGTVETFMRYFFFLTIITLFIVGLLSILDIINIPNVALIVLLFLLLPSSIGLRSYKNAWKNWRSLRSGKYGFAVFLNALVQIECSRWMYIKGYVNGLLDRDPKKIKGRQVLWATLNQ